MPHEHADDRRQSAGARFRAALAAEKPLQVIGAINAYHALLAERVRLQGDLPVRRRRRRRLARPARPRHQQPRRRADRRAPHHRRLRRCRCWSTSTPASAPRAFNIARTVKSLIKSGAARDAHRGPGRRQALRPPAGQGARVAGRDGRPRSRRRSMRSTDPDFVIMARTDALAVEGLEAAIERALRLRRGRRRHDLPRGDDRARDVPAVRRRGEGADPRQHHRVRRDAAVHRRRTARRRRRRSCSIRCRRSAR